MRLDISNTILVFFEDKDCENFYPLNILRSTSDLLLGSQSIQNSIIKYIRNDSFSEILYWLRPHLDSFYPESQSFLKSLIDDQSVYFFISSRFLLKSSFYLELGSYYSDNEQIYSFKILGKSLRKLIYDDHLNPFDQEVFFDILSKFLKNSSLEDLKYKKLTSSVDFINENLDYIKESFFDRLLSKNIISRFLNRKNIFLGKNVSFFGNSYLDEKNGPIIIDDGAKIYGYSYIQGPAYIGKNVELYNAIVKSSSVFDYCKIGVEIDSSILYPYINHAHKGYIGHSIIGSFVNFGAMSIISDLKNTYQAISIDIGKDKKKIETGRIKFGALIGDYNKFGVASLIYSGSIFGIANNLFFEGIPYPKNIPSFIWGSKFPFQEYKFEKFLKHVTPPLERRDKKLTLERIKLFQDIFNMEMDWRNQFLDQG